MKICRNFTITNSKTMTIQDQLIKAKDGLTQGELDSLIETTPVVVCDYLPTWTNVKTEINDDTVNYFYKGFLISVSIDELETYDGFDLEDEDALNETIGWCLEDNGVYNAIDNHGTRQLTNLEKAA